MDESVKKVREIDYVQQVEIRSVEWQRLGAVKLDDL